MTASITRKRLAVLACMSIGLGVAACGDDDDDASPDATTGTTAAPSDTAAPPTETEVTSTDTAATSTPVTDDAGGCGEGSYTELQVLGTNLDQVARCEPGGPDPVPLSERGTLTIATSSLTSEASLPLLLAQENGEFEKENLEVEIVELAPTDALPLLAQDEIDAQVTAAGASMFNAVASGFDVRWVLPVSFGPPGQQEGLWARGADVQLEDLADMKIASAVGLGSPVSYNMQTELSKIGLSWGALQFEVLPAADIPEALRSGAVDAAVLISPFWIEFQDDPEYTHLLTNTPAGEPLSAVLFAPNLIGERHDVGDAFTRAWIRTISTYLSGPDYKSDQTFCQEAAAVLQQDPASFCAVPGTVYDYEVKLGTTDRMQDTYFQLDVLEYAEPLPESQLVDRSFIEEALGHSYAAG